VDDTTASGFALVGPGRAGTAVADGWVAAGHRGVAAAGRASASAWPSTWRATDLVVSPDDAPWREVPA
jgi:hypothetical protein